MTIPTNLNLAENQYLSDLTIDIKHQLTHLEAPTGRGKTTFIIEELAKKSKIIMVCPTKVQVAQLAHDFSDNPKVQCITGKEGSNAIFGDIIICVYDKLRGLLESGRHFSTYMLVIDEAHKMYQAASYRRNAIAVLLDAISDGLFKQVLTVSATFQPEIFPFDFDEQIVIDHQQNQNQKPTCDVIFHKKKGFMDQYLFSTLPSKGDISIIRLNNKEQIKRAKLCFEQKDLRVFEIHSDNQKSPEVIKFLETSLIGDYDIVLTTSLLDEAINIKNTNIESVHIYHKLHCDEVNQFIGRTRKSQPHVHLHLLESELNREDIDITKERRELEDLCELTLQYCLAISKKPSDFSRAVTDINMTTKHCQGFEPLFYDYCEGGEPSVNNVSILAKLYDISMEAQYVNDDSLRFALLGTNCFSKVEIFNSNITDDDDEIDAIIEQASVMQESARISAVNECAEEVGATDDNITNVSVDDVDALASKHSNAGIKGEISNEWLGLCRILSVADALDAVKNNRTSQVWTFQKSVEHFIHLRPFFDVLKADLKAHGQVKLVGSDGINKYFIKALSKAAKEQKHFKKLIKKLNPSGIEVLENNQFKVSNRFLYKFIREVTDGELYRSGGVPQFTITRIGPFGYDYNINSLRTSNTKRRIRRRAA
jgi:hypothetical protein